jgi:hypothetical protein
VFVGVRLDGGFGVGVGIVFGDGLDRGFDCVFFLSTVEFVVILSVLEEQATINKTNRNNIVICLSMLNYNHLVKVDFTLNINQYNHC